MDWGPTADVSTRFYTSASWRQWVGPLASWLDTTLLCGISEIYFTIFWKRFMADEREKLYLIIQVEVHWDPSFFLFFLTKNFSTDSKLTSTQEIPDPLEKSDRSYTCAAGKQGCCSRQSGCNSGPSTSQWCQLKWPWSTKGGTYGN